MTPYRLLRGKDYRGIVVEFAECVLLKLAGAQPKLASRWEKGIWLGKRNSTTSISSGRRSAPPLQGPSRDGRRSANGRETPSRS